MRSILQIMKQQVEQAFVMEQFELLAVSTGVSKEAETEKEIPFLRFEVEVPKDIKPFGRTRFSVKVVSNEPLSITQEQIDEGEIYLIAFTNLVISYIDTKGIVYFRADTYEIERSE